MNADGSNIRQISFAESPRYDARAGYVSSGNRVVFNRQMDRTFGIYILNLDDG
ncbi:MAG: hypothetical protein SGI94_21565 [Saprospiraceae bacterium]|nr:hypothetical protein [Saprospiraceae bacterium]